jgi:hypothetical protein
MDKPGDPDGKIISLDFARRARAGQARHDADAPTDLPGLQGLTLREFDTFNAAYQSGAALGLFTHYRLWRDGDVSYFDMCHSRQGNWPVLRVMKSPYWDAPGYTSEAPRGYVMAGLDFSFSLDAIGASLRGYVRRRAGGGPKPA